MISIAYAPRCDAVSAMRNDSFLRRNDLKGLVAATRNRSFSWLLRDSMRNGEALAALQQARIGDGSQVAVAKKLHKSASKSLKRLFRVTIVRRPVLTLRQARICRRLANQRQS